MREESELVIEFWQQVLFDFVDGWVSLGQVWVLVLVWWECLELCWEWYVIYLIGDILCLVDLVCEVWLVVDFFVQLCGCLVVEFVLFCLCGWQVWLVLLVVVVSFVVFVIVVLGL